MSQQYFYNGVQYTTPTSYAAQSVNACYAAAVAQPLTSVYTAVTTDRAPLVAGYNVSGPQLSSAHRSQAPVTYTYPTNATVIASPLGVIPGTQATLVAPPHVVGKVGPPSFVIANGPTSAPQNMTNNGAYTVTTSYFQQMPGQNHVQQHNMAQAVAAAQQANYHAALVAANNTRGRRNNFDTRYQQFRKNAKATAIETQVFYCDVCKISCAGPQTYREHLEGQKHKKKAAGTSIAVSLSTKSSQRQLRCELCDVTCTGVDAYQSHIRGTKHQKTFKLHQRLGKPIPCADPLVVKAVPTSTSDTNAESGVSSVKISAVPKINFTNATTLKSVTDVSVTGEKVPSHTFDVTDPGKLEEHVDLKSLQEKAVPPVGNEYIETTTNESGKVIQFFCKLCSCKFNDPHAKEMHLKGRRHRLQYKRKVDPSLIVDVKSGTNRSLKLEEDRMRQKQQREEFWRRRDMQSRMREMQRLEYSNLAGYSGMRHLETLDDRHLLAKHASIYPTEEEIQAMQSMVSGCEKALRGISEVLLDVAPVTKDDKLPDDSKRDESPKVATPIAGEKLLSGAMRVGPLAKALLLRGEVVVSLVLLCSKWPTFSLMDKVVEKLPEKLKDLLPNDDIEVSVNSDYQCILVSRKKELEMHCYIHFTSSAIREETSDGAVAVQPEDGLDRKRCLDALASLRHTKWFQAKVSSQPTCLILIRILRDLCQRVATWSPLSSWAVELLAEKVVSSDPMKLSLGGALRRFFECVSSGILLSCGPGLKDPCEKEVTDASALLAAQDREDITASAQHALRLIAFRQTHKVLDMEALSSTAVEDKAAASARKRRHSGGEDEEEVVTPANQKKDKKEAKEAEEEEVKEEPVDKSDKSEPAK